MTGKGTKKFRFPVAVHLDKAVGIKNANGKVGERRRLVKMYSIAKMGVLFEKSKR